MLQFCDGYINSKCESATWFWNVTSSEMLLYSGAKTSLWNSYLNLKVTLFEMLLRLGAWTCYLRKWRDVFVI